MKKFTMRVEEKQNNPVEQKLTNVEEDAAFNKNRKNFDKDKADEDFIRALQEWDMVDSVVASSDGKDNSNARNLPYLSYLQAYEYFKKANMEPFLKNIHPVIQRQGFSAFRHKLFGPPSLHTDLIDDRNLVFALAACPFDNSNIVHNQLLLMIYKQLTKTVKDCPRFGPHWETIGFQGNDPATDLRGVGILGLLHLLYILTNKELVNLCSLIYELSHHPKHNFPFCVMGLNLTRITLQALREEKLNRISNKRKSVMKVVNDFFSGLYFRLYIKWRTSGLTIIDSGWILKDLEFYGKKHSNAIFRELQRYISKQKLREAEEFQPYKPESPNAEYIFHNVFTEASTEVTTPSNCIKTSTKTDINDVQHHPQINNISPKQTVSSKTLNEDLTNKASPALSINNTNTDYREGTTCDSPLFQQMQDNNDSIDSTVKEIKSFNISVPDIQINSIPFSPSPFYTEEFDNQSPEVFI